jgi:hypothetical protein
MINIFEEKVAKLNEIIKLKLSARSDRNRNADIYAQNYNI